MEVFRRMCKVIKKELTGKGKEIMICTIRKMIQKKVKDSVTENKWDSWLNPHLRTEK